MGNYTVAALCMILPVDVLHHLLITDRKVSLVNAHLVSLIEPVPQQGYHRLTESILILRLLLESLDLPLVLPGDNAQYKHTGLLHPVFFYHLNDHSPGHTHPLLSMLITHRWQTSPQGDFC